MIAIKKKLKKSLIAVFRGHRQTVKLTRPLDESGEPIPWMTYPAINYLKQIDFSDCSVFEYGCGTSTQFWSSRANRVISVEHDEQWVADIGALALPNVELMHAKADAYIEACRRGAPHDVIVVDGRWRYDCAMVCLGALSPTGMVILDNSERYPAITEHFRAAGLIQVDLIGPGPVNKYIWSTSIFLSRTINLKPLKSIQPHGLVGMVDSIETSPQMAAVNRPGSF